MSTLTTRRTTADVTRRAKFPAAAMLLLAVLSGAGCASRGVHPVRIAAPDSPSASVRNSKGDAIETYLVSVDGRPVPYRKIVVSPDLSVPVILPAGTRRLEVTISEFTSRGETLYGYTFDYPFVAGHDYELTQTKSDDRRVVVVVDATAGTRLVIAKPKRP